MEQEFTPSSWQQAKRSKLGTHLTCLDVWDDWVVCGGGPNLSLWYLKEGRRICKFCYCSLVGFDGLCEFNLDVFRNVIICGSLVQRQFYLLHSNIYVPWPKGYYKNLSIMNCNLNRRWSNSTWIEQNFIFRKIYPNY